MLLTLLLLLVLLWHFYLGYSRGIVKQTYYFLSVVASLFVAGMHYLPLADRLTLWVPYSQVVSGGDLPYFSDVNIFEMDQVFYSGLAFLLIFLASYAVFGFLGIFLHLFKINRLDDPLLNTISGFLAVLVTLMIFNILLTLVATIPFATIQQMLSSNLLVKGLIKHFPVLSQLWRHLWVTAVLG